VIALTEEVEQQVVLWKQGEKAAKSGDWSLAADAYEQIVKHRPESGEALAELAWCQSRAGDDVSAIESYGAAVRQGHKVRDSLYQLARCHARLGQTETALTYLDLSLATGFNKGQAMADDEAFAALADDSRFSALVEAARAAGHRADKSDSYGGKAKKSDAWSETETI
jgi:tetratricopeptide (TPR) repeat protein